MDKKWKLNFGNLFYLIEKLVDIGQTEIDECIFILNKSNNLNYQFDKPNYCKIKGCERNMFPYFYDERIKFVPILCKQIFKDEMIKIRFMNELLCFCEDIVELNKDTITKLSQYKDNNNIQDFLLCLIEIANYEPNHGDSLFKDRIDINKLLSTKLEEKKTKSSYANNVKFNDLKMVIVSPTRINNNDFIERKEIYQEIMDKIYSPCGEVIYLYGLPGNGKTSLAKKVFDDISNENYHKFGFSAKLRPEELSLEYMFNEILRAFGNDRPGFLKLEEKENEVNKLLCGKFIFVLDDLEKSPEVEKVLEWVFRLNDQSSKFNSKFIITCQDTPKKVSEKIYNKICPLGDFNEISQVIKISGLNEYETSELIERQINKTTHLKQVIIKDKNFLKKIIDTLYKKTDGNPQAIKVAISYIENMITCGNELDSILTSDNIWDSENIVKKMFKYMWSNLLDDDTKKIISTVALIPKGITAKRIFQITNIPEITPEGFISNESRLGRANNSAVDSSMVELSPAEEIGEKPVYSNHGIVYDFIRKMLEKNECPIIAEVNESIIQWYLNKCEKIGYCYSDIKKLEFFDNEFDVIYAIMKRCYENKRYEIVLRFADAIKYYLIVKFVFFENTPSIHQLCLKSAQHLNDELHIVKEYIWALNILSKRGNIESANTFYQYLSDDEDKYMKIMDTDVKCQYYHAMALYFFVQKNYEMALTFWKRFEEIIDEIPVGEVNVCLRWLAKCYMRLNKFDKARKYNVLAYKNAVENGFDRNRVDIELFMIEIELFEFENNLNIMDLEKESSIINRLLNVKKDSVYLIDTKVQAKWNFLYSKTKYNSVNPIPIEEILKYADDAYKLYGDIFHEDKQEDIIKWVRSINPNFVFSS